MTALQTPFQTRADADWAEKHRAERVAQGLIALKRLANEVRSCRALGCAGSWKVAPHHTDPDTWVFTLVLPNKAFADRLEETLHGAD